MNERISEEIMLARGQYPKLENGENWILIPEYKLPVGRFNMNITAVLFNIPLAYPNVGPDDFFIDANLRLLDGTVPLAFNPNPNSSSGPAPLPGNWGWFSWHPQWWRPSANPLEGDNLLTFIKSIGVCLRGEESA